MEIREFLRTSGLRRTPAREAVLRLLCQARRPLNHEQIAAAPSTEGMDRVTLYRTLTALQEAGLAHRVQGKDGVWHFCAHPSEEGDGCPGNHPHFLCLRCGGMRCLRGQSLPWVTVDEGERVIGKHLVVYGSCSACAKGQGKRRARPRRP
jgi:Fur family ferric uptake transcriptional regulator/Fur family zinc uptake transcriptional regulator